MRGAASSNQSISRLANGVVPVALDQLSPRNRARWQRSLLDIVAGIATDSPGDNEFRAFVLDRLAEVDAVIAGNGKAVAS